VTTPRRKRAELSEMPGHAITGKPCLGVTKHWPPPIGWYYSGHWSPTFRTRSTGRSKRTINMNMD
jgi:hypothetical protein